jgi:hypothetical protein
MSKLIKQKYDWDCYIACMAMYLGVSYSDILNAYIEFVDNKFYQGITDNQAMKLLKIAGVRPAIRTRLVKGVKSIVTVPSLNDDGGFHVLYFDGKKFFDPNTNVEGKKFYRQNVKNVVSCLIDKDNL